jgi:hypothetical protein
MAKRKKVDYSYWWDVPVTIVGTPNPDAVRAMWDSVREFAIKKDLEAEIVRRKEHLSTTVNVRDDRGIDIG